MAGVLAHVRRAAPGASARCPRPDAVDLLRAGPALRRPQHDHRPRGRRRSAFVRAACWIARSRRARRRAPRPAAGARRRVVARDDDRPLAVALEQLHELLLGDAGEHGRVRDLVAVQVQDRQHRAVGDRVQELVRVPARRERSGLRLAVADDARDEQVGIVERRAERVRERVAELAALVDRSRRLGRDVARDPAGKRELPEEAAQPLFVLADRADRPRCRFPRGRRSRRGRDRRGPGR